MLVQFMAKNVLSFRNEFVLDMTAINSYKEHKCNLIDTGSKDKLVRVASIYGANASGKSNLHLAMYFFQRIISESLNNVKENEETILEKFYVPFAFEKTKENSEFQIIEIVGDYEYRYGFEYNDKRIVSEWLYSKKIDTNRQMVILERAGKKLNLGASVRKECSMYKEQIPEETLALSFFNKLNFKSDVFRTVYTSIMSTLVMPSDFLDSTSMLEKLLPQIIDDDKKSLVEFLTAIDTGIKDIAHKKTGDKTIEFETIHAGKDGETYRLNLYNESAGTIRAIALYIYSKLSVESNCSFFVDEINIKLHPLLLKFIVDLFYNQNTSAQLIYTTHDTTLMDKKFFRRDQIWFVQKDEYGYSDLSSLAEFKIRSDASFEKDYLAGVYGGIPKLKDFSIEEGE